VRPLDERQRDRAADDADGEEHVLPLRARVAQHRDENERCAEDERERGKHRQRVAPARHGVKHRRWAREDHRFER
jgi:hypothetical protein